MRIESDRTENKGRHNDIMALGPRRYKYLPPRGTNNALQAVESDSLDCRMLRNGVWMGDLPVFGAACIGPIRP